MAETFETKYLDLVRKLRTRGIEATALLMGWNPGPDGIHYTIQVGSWQHGRKLTVVSGLGTDEAQIAVMKKTYDPTVPATPDQVSKEVDLKTLLAFGQDLLAFTGD
ncbi:MAG: hypothetical protein US42_C0018G0014 [Candidatus Magasanikbacteria bacterium GW2011_GWC2_37_14]|uniref:Uncharacterized protein n=1 Tax=Candidatus Magasanikbacteria bacterium GW2011_GWC2_37_14 TaxID=1619046 RepID=A0A0G0GLA8_9BACT|nr:MAG: hypothetical protein US42_C0018G0014 [Candidatus Magasanikbacteria bacterium GW2011_GWC2_37_14]